MAGITRRAALAAGMGAGLGAAAPGWAAAGSPRWLAAARDAAGDHALVGLDADAAPLFRIPLPGRGHAAAAHPDRPLAVAFARRPGTFAMAIDCAAGAVVARLSAPAGRHFFGHGAFSAAGGRLFTTENAYDTGDGLLGVWETEGWRRIGEVPTGGVGPHEVVRAPDGALIVANGGLRTHPDTGRAVLNREAMRPSLARVDAETGALTDRAEPPAELRFLSLRHLAVRADGLCAAAGQWEGEAGAEPPLLAFWRPGAPLRWAAPDAGAAGRTAGYAGSVAFDPTGAAAAITCPRGGVALAAAADDGRPLGLLAADDVCGVAPAPGGFLLTDGFGGARFAAPGAEGWRARPVATADLAWDNHVVTLPPSR
jgi:hypothetical protein